MMADLPAKETACLHPTRRAVQLCLVGVLLGAFAGSSSTAAQNSMQADPVTFVHPFIGTGGDPSDGSETFPGATRPFGMVQLSPDTEDHGYGYHWIHGRIRGFSMTHISGAGGPSQGDVFFTATTGPISTQPNDYQSPYAHQQESSAAGAYRVRLLEWGIDAELTATERTGVARFRFPAGSKANILVPISHTLNVSEAAAVHVIGNNRIEGFVENYVLYPRPYTYRVYFAMEFDRPFASFGTWSGAEDNGPGRLAEGSRSAEQQSHKATTGAYASWQAQLKAQTVVVRIGISYVDQQGASANLKAESGDKNFDRLRREARASWSQELRQAQVRGGTKQQRAVFYTALYHSLLAPSLFDDVDGRYAGFDGEVHRVAPGHHAYTNFSGWDIYRSQIPLLCLLEPERMEDMAQSVVNMYRQGGWMPRWPHINAYTNDMIGSPLSIALATAWLDGLHGFDMDAAWPGIWADATEAVPPGKPYLGREDVEWLNSTHFLPADKVSYGSVAKTLEYSLADAAVSRLAAALHKPDQAAVMRRRALYYRNLFDPEMGFFRPRNADGTWVPDFNPALDGHGFVEGTGWHYATFAPADMGWLVDAMGAQRFNTQLSAFFDYPSPGWYAKRFNPYNETDLQAPFAFYFSGQPWQTQRVVRRVLRENYRDDPDGIPGNDDLGGMSSWAVWTMLGLYSVDPPSQAWEILAPAFPAITIHLRKPYTGATLQIRRTGVPNGGNIDRVRWNGAAHPRNWIDFHQLTAGGTLEIHISSQPSPPWGTRRDQRPPSLSDAEFH